MALKTLVITGANGYLGKHTIKAAISDGWNVIGIVRRQEAAREVESLGGKPIILENFEVNSLKKTFTDCKAIIHFRGVVCGPKKLFEKINIDGMKILVKAAKEMDVPRIIFPSGLLNQCGVGTGILLERNPGCFLCFLRNFVLAMAGPYIESRNCFLTYLLEVRLCM